MLNKVMLIGNLGQDPELITTKSDTTVCNINLATSSSRKVDNEWINETEWHRVTLFGKNAENCCEYLAKGSSIYVEGRLKTEKWKDSEGVDRYGTKIVGSVIKFLGKKQASTTTTGTGEEG